MEETRKHFQRGGRGAHEVQDGTEAGNVVAQVEADFRRRSPLPTFVVVLLVRITDGERDQLSHGKAIFQKRRLQADEIFSLKLFLIPYSNHLFYLH